MLRCALEAIESLPGAFMNDWSITTIKRIKKATLGGGQWSIRWKDKIRKDDCWGLCEYDENRISILNTLKPFRLCDTSLHEGLHAIFPDLSEEAVTEAATELATLLWRIGFRLPS